MKRCRTLISLAVVFMMIAAMTACSPKASVKKAITVAYICVQLDNSWFQGTTSAFKAKCLEMGATKVLVLDSKNDPELALEQVDSVIAQKVAGVVINLPDQKMSRAVVDKLNKAKIPVIGSDDPLIENGKIIAPTYELDAYHAGYEMSEYLANYVKKNNLTTNVNDTMYANLAALPISSFVPRTTGANDAWSKILPDYPKDKMLTVDTKTAETENAYTAFSATIAAHPQVKTWFVTSVNDEVSMGAVRALQQANMDHSSYVVGLGGYLNKAEFKKPFTCVIASSYLNAHVDGQTNAEALMNNILKGTEIYSQFKRAGSKFGDCYLEPTIVTKENYIQVMGADAN